MNPSNHSARRRIHGAVVATVSALLCIAQAGAQTTSSPVTPVVEGEIVRALMAGEDVSAQIALLRTAPLPAKPSASTDSASAMQRFERALGALRVDAARTRASGSDATISAGETLRAADLLVQAQFDRLRQAAASALVPGLESRIDEAQTRWRARVDPVLTLLGKIETAAPAMRASLLDELIGSIDAQQIEPAIAVYGARILPQHRPRLLPRAPRMQPNVAPSYGTATLVEPIDVDYAASAEAPLSAAVRAQAQSLGNDYIAIFDFVRSQVRTQWYAGAQKGADETLRTRAGNDVDQASLLIALLRASRAAARYVTGVVEVPVADLGTQLGVDPSRVGAALSAAGIAHAPVIAQGRVAAFRIEQVWVAAYVPYENYRGSAADDHRRSWIPLMPALKPATFTAASDVLGPAALDIALHEQGWLSQGRDRLPWPALRDELAFRLSQLQPPLGLDAQASRHALDADPIELLPASAPYPVRAVNLESHELLEEQRQWLRLVMRASPAADAAVVLDAKWPLSDVGLERISLGYAPASVEDQHLANARGGLSDVPAYLVRVRPSLWLDGRPSIAGIGTMDTGVAHRLEITLSGPGGEVTADQLLISGGIAALALDPQGDAPRADVDQIAASDPGASRVAGQFALRYAREWSVADADSAALLGTTVFRPLPGATLVLPQYRVDQVLGLPHRLSFEGVALDALLRPIEPVAQQGDEAREADWLRVSALHGSALEHDLFKRLWDVEAISADDGLQRAAEAGIPRLTLRPSDDAQTILAAHDAAVRDDVEAWLDQGLDVEIARDPLQIQAWRGSVWRALNPATGESGYFIAGRYAGGATVIPPDLWTIPSLADLFANPYAGLPNDDPLAAFLLQIDQSAQAQTGAAGTELEEPLSAYVSDFIGRPVLGARVTFTVREGGGTLDGGNVVTVSTDARGVAQANLTLPQRQQGLGNYFYEDGEEFPQWGSINTVDVRVDSEMGPITAELPYRAYTLPGDPAALRVIVPPGANPITPGFSFVRMDVMVVDAYDNEVNNQLVTVNVSDTLATPTCDGHEIESAPRSGLFLPGACPANDLLYAGDACTSPSVQVKTRPGRASFNLAPTAAMESTIHLSASSGVGGFSTNITTRGDIRPVAPDDNDCQVWAWAGIRQSTYNLYGGAGNYGTNDTPMEVAEPGELFALTRNFSAGFSLAMSWVGWGNYTPPAETNISIAGAQMLGPRAGAGMWEYDMRAGGPGHVTGQIVMPFPEPFEEPFVAATPRAWVVDMRAPTIEPARVVVSPFQRSTGETTILAGFTPSDYVARNGTIELLADGEVDASCNQVFVNGNYKCRFGEGRAFDPEKDYSARYSINSGTPYYLASEETELEFSRGIVAGFGVDTSNAPLPALNSFIERRYPKRISIKHEIDVPTGWQCPESARFVYAVGQRAQVSISFYSLGEDGDRGNLAWEAVEERLHTPGVFEFNVGTTDLKFGEFEYEIRAVAESDGHEEVYVGRASNSPQRRDSLPLAHPFVKGVDLFSGHAVVSTEDAAVGGRGPGMKFTRTYASHGGNELTYLGRGWNSDLDSSVVADRCGSYVVTGAAGQGQRFIADGVQDDGSVRYRALHGYHGTLIATIGGGFDFVAKDGTRYRFEEPDLTGVRLSYVEDPNGNRVTYEYAGNTLPRQVARMTDSAGRTLEMDYDFVVLRDGEDESGYQVTFTRQLLVSVRGPMGLRIDYEYDADSNLVQVTRKLGSATGTRREVYGYEDRGGLWLPEPSGELRYHHFGFRLNLSRNDIDGGERHYAYALGFSGFPTDDGPIYIPEQRVIEVIEPDGGQTTFDYLGIRGLGPTTTNVTDARSNLTRYDLNGYGAATAVTDAAGITRTDWNFAALQPSRVTDAAGTVTDYEYDTQGNKTSERIQHASGNLERQWTFHPPTNFATPIKNRVATFEDARGNVTNTSWDARGNLTGILRGGIAEGYGVSGNGDRVSRTNGAGEVTNYRYDQYGNVEGEFDGFGAIRGAQFDALGRKISESDGEGNVTRLEYDSRDRVTATLLPATGAGAASTRRVEYRDAQRIRVETNENNHATVYEHDAMGRVLSITNPLGRSRDFEYDKNGNKTRETDFRGNPTVYTYDAANRMTRRAEPLGRVTTYTHDELGHVLSEVTADRQVQYRYGHPSYLRTMVRRLVNGTWLEIASEFDGNGNEVSTTDARSNPTVRQFDARDRLTKQTEPEGRVTDFGYDDADRKISEFLSGPNLATQKRHFGYDSRGREVSRIDGAGGEWLTTYDLNGNATSRSDPRGNVTSFGYDARGRMLLQSGPIAGREMRYGYDGVGNRTDEQQANGRTIQHRFDAMNRLEASTDVGGSISPAQFAAFGYDDDGNRTSATDANGNVTTFEVDELNRVTAEHRPLGRNLSWTHNIHGDVLTETDALGRTTTHAVDELGRRTSTTSPSPFGYVTQFGLDENGNVVTLVNARNLTTTSTYDGLNRRLTQTDPPVGGTAFVQRWTYDAAGNVVAYIDRRGVVENRRYDGENRQIDLERDNQRKWSRALDAAGNVLRETDANGNDTTFAYNAANEKTSAQRPDGVIERWSYHPWGDVQSATDPDGIVTSYTYDLRRRLLSETTPSAGGAATTEYEYDGQGNRTAVTRPNGGASWRFAYDDANRLRSVTSPGSANTTFQYDLADRRTVITDAEQRSTTTTHDEIGRPTHIAYADGTSESIGQYDGNGNVLTRTDPNGRTQGASYDALDRRITRTWSGAAEPGDVIAESYAYDPSGNQTLIVQNESGGGQHETVRTWDRQNRMRSETDRWSQQMQLDYDANGNRDSRADPAGNTVFQNDRNDRLRSIQPVAEGAIAITYTPGGRPSGFTYPNGASATLGYDASGRVATITHVQNGTTVTHYEYRYDRNGNRLSEERVTSAGTRRTDYDYDSDDRLTGFEIDAEDGSTTTTAYTLDDVGNRRTERVTRGATVLVDRSYVYNARHQLESSHDDVTDVTTEYDYDDNGNLTREQTGAQITTYRINPQDRIATLTGPTGPPVDYAYDPDGRRVLKRTNVEAVRFGWDAMALRRETNVTNNPLASYDWAGGRVVRTRRGSTTSYAQHDALKSPTRWSRADGGELARATYDAWGNASQQSGTLPPIGFTGYYADAESRLLYAQQRYYAPHLGRFTRVDPWEGDVLNPITLNKYLYANGNPVIYIDPDGRISFLSDAERVTKESVASYQADIERAKKDGAGGRAFFLGIGKGLASLGDMVVSGLNTTSNLAARGLYDGETRDQIERELAEDQMAMTNAIETTDRTITVIKEDPGGAAAAVGNAAVDFGSKVLEGDPGAMAALGEFTGQLVVPGAGAKSVKVAGESIDVARAAMRMDGDFLPAGMADDLADLTRGTGRGEAPELRHVPEPEARTADGSVRFQRWRRGDAIDKPLPDGSAPTWDTVQSRYWKNRHQASVDSGEFSPRQLAEMRKGNSPEDFNPRTMQWERRELHHVTGRQYGGSNGPLNLRELTPDWHAEVDPFRIRPGITTTRGIR